MLLSYYEKDREFVVHTHDLSKYKNFLKYEQMP